MQKYAKMSQTGDWRSKKCGMNHPKMEFTQQE
jgi:hypothetical protein